MVLYFKKELYNKDKFYNVTIYINIIVIRNLFPRNYHYKKLTYRQLMEILVQLIYGKGRE